MSEHFNAPKKKIYKGSHKIHKFQLTLDEVAYDLTNVTEITFIVKDDNSESAATVYSCTMTGTDIERQTPYTDGKIHISVIPADTSSATSGKKVYYISLVDADSNTIYFGKGEYEIIRT